jgi:precorrin-2 C20-methyltransferase/precorrin-3B C17-methyltransferase
MTGRLFGVGVGPGDPDLLTLKAARIIRQAQVVAYPATRRGHSNARAIAAEQFTPEHIELPLIYPLTTEASDTYEEELRAFYDASASSIAAHLDRGFDVAVLCEGDPFFYGSFMYLHDRLAHRYSTEVVPGVTSVSAASARLGMPLVRRDEELSILPGTLPQAALTAKLREGGACAIMKLGRNFTKIRTALQHAGAHKRARYIERATMPNEHIAALDEADPENVPYFSLVLVPAIRDERMPRNVQRPIAGPSLRIVGLGPGSPEWLSPEAREALHEASDLVGYQPYLDRVPPLPGQRRHGSDNRLEIERAQHALELAEEGNRVCVVSSGDPGIFAMASAVMEALENGPPRWRELDIQVLPGISAMQAAAARVGAPLGHDFCVLSLSDRLKPWEAVEKRLHAAASADLVLALYNPLSSQRRRQLGLACEIIRNYRAPDTPVVIARNLGGTGERVVIAELAGLDTHDVDMRTILLIGSSATRSFTSPSGRRFVYTPRSQHASRAPEKAASPEPAAS